ncbi:Fic family protein [Rubrivivax gelatinosus]|uniref:Fic family protein n=1 Tax=Rubrivivax gelatinosus TaxID=28068 RepID=A0A4R2MGE5_RUBGE|nr:Fic family protein [Rubrivivax gelatinosus]MBK1689676.1 cell filamentation protein Fic [Rubrivivax gelatinosus]TCP01816.1 Fic family protein [Rubrivivax gelatinosus]
MKSQKIACYEAPQHFEPLMPGALKLEPLLELAGDLVRESASLGAAAAPAARSELRALLRSMNSYYTNRIEGEHTRPSDIERALQQDYAGDADTARRQRLAVAHIETEQQCEERLDGMLAENRDAVPRWLYSAECVQWLHESLFSGLGEQDLRLADGSLLVPGRFRERQVTVGRHEAPLHTALDAFVSRWAQLYGSVRRGEASVVAAMASHHRLAWVHPFADGNGRVCRLHTHLVLHAAGLTHGLWSPLRGFARSQVRYKQLLQAADEHRQGDLDGRGNLTEAGFVDWIGYALETCLDQARFMRQMLDVADIQGRIDAALSFEQSARQSGVRREALRPLHYLFATQTELARADFKAMTGLGDRLATGLVSSLIARGFLRSDTPYGKLRFAVPQHALRFYFPNLWPEAEAEV